MKWVFTHIYAFLSISGRFDINGFNGRFWVVKYMKIFHLLLEMGILYDSEPLFPSIFMVNTAGSQITEHDDDGIEDYFDVGSNDSNYFKKKVKTK